MNNLTRAFSLLLFFEIIYLGTVWPELATEFSQSQARFRHRRYDHNSCYDSGRGSLDNRQKHHSSTGGEQASSGATNNVKSNAQNQFGGRQTDTGKGRSDSEGGKRKSAVVRHDLWGAWPY